MTLCLANVQTPEGELAVMDTGVYGLLTPQHRARVNVRLVREKYRLISGFESRLTACQNYCYYTDAPPPPVYGRWPGPIASDAEITARFQHAVNAARFEERGFMCPFESVPPDWVTDGLDMFEVQDQDTFEIRSLPREIRFPDLWGSLDFPLPHFSLRAVEEYLEGEAMEVWQALKKIREARTVIDEWQKRNFSAPAAESSDRYHKELQRFAKWLKKQSADAARLKEAQFWDGWSLIDDVPESG